MISQMLLQFLLNPRDIDSDTEQHYILALRPSEGRLDFQNLTINYDLFIVGWFDVTNLQLSLLIVLKSEIAKINNCQHKSPPKC